MGVRDLTVRNAIEDRLKVRIYIFIFDFSFLLNFLEESVEVVRGPVREVVRGPSPLDWSMDRGSVFSGHPKKKCVYLDQRDVTGP